MISGDHHTRRALAILVLLALFSRAATPAPAGNSWNKIRYQGGTVEAKVNPFDWNTTLTIRPPEVEVVFAGRKRVVIPVSDITAISYGQQAYRRVADLAVLSVFATPVALFGLLHKSKDHIISIQYRTPDRQTGAILLTVHKDQYRELLETLRRVTGKPVENWP